MHTTYLKVCLNVSHSALHRPLGLLHQYFGRKVKGSPCRYLRLQSIVQEQKSGESFFRDQGWPGNLRDDRRGNTDLQGGGVLSISWTTYIEMRCIMTLMRAVGASPLHLPLRSWYDKHGGRPQARLSQTRAGDSMARNRKKQRVETRGERG